MSRREQSGLSGLPGARTVHHSVVTAAALTAPPLRAAPGQSSTKGTPTAASLPSRASLQTSGHTVSVGRPGPPASSALGRLQSPGTRPRDDAHDPDGHSLPTPGTLGHAV